MARRRGNRDRRSNYAAGMSIVRNAYQSVRWQGFDRANARAFVTAPGFTRVHTQGYAAYDAGLRRATERYAARGSGSSVGSFKTRHGQYVKGKGGRFIGSK